MVKMLIDHLVTHCDAMYNKESCQDCNHPTNNCKCDCKVCLDEVHWIKPNGRRDYDCENLLYYYTCRYSYKYCSEIIYALEEINLSDYPCYDILSLGCGAAPDLMAFNCINEKDKKPIRYRGCDRNPLWKSIHDEIESFTTRACDNTNAVLQRKDVFSVLGNDKPRKNFNVVIIQYLLSHLYNTWQISDVGVLFDSLIDNVLEYRRDDSPFLIVVNDIDSRHKGRDFFWAFYEKIKSAGYYVDVMAKCFKPEIHLECATRYPYSYNKFSIPDHIKDFYKCAIECTSAQIIIEVR